MTEKTPLTVRFPRDLYLLIKQQAKRNHRSLSAQVVHMLQEACREKIYVPDPASTDRWLITGVHTLPDEESES